jgi:transposase
MAIRLVEIDRETPMMFPPSVQEWLPENHMARFIVDIIDKIDMSRFHINETGSGSEQYDPRMMVGLLIYCYATGIFGSRRIERATYTDIAVMYICGGKAHPEFSRICAFRRENEEAFKEVFTKVLMVAQNTGILKKIGGISVDGTKIHANANKHKAVSYQRAKELIEATRKEIEELIKKANEAESTPLEEGLTIPEEIQRRTEREAALKAAVEEMEEQYEEAREEERDTKGKKGEGGGRKGKRGSKKPLEAYQYNFTDPESRIMKNGNNKSFEQSYNAEAAVDTEGSMLIVGGYVTNHGNDKKELAEVVARVNKKTREVDTVSADTGFFSEEAVKEVERPDKDGNKRGPEVYCAVEKTHHGKTVKDLEKKKPMGRMPKNASVKERMSRKLKTKKGSKIYKKRKETVEPSFGIIKQAMGFRQFLLRGMKKVNIEWSLIMAAYNVKKLHSILYGIIRPKCPVMGYL